MCSGYGIKDAHTPSTNCGSISQCVCSDVYRRGTVKTAVCFSPFGMVMLASSSASVAAGCPKLVHVIEEWLRGLPANLLPSGTTSGRTNGLGAM